MSKEKTKNESEQDSANKETDDEFVLEEPSTESVPPSPVTGQTADESQEKPGQ